jgi:hypothetical protein
MNKLSIQKYFILSFGTIFFITGVAKLWSSYGSARVLEEYDPIFGITFYHLMQVVGIVELVLAVFCWVSCYSATAKNMHQAIFLVTWFSTLLLGYRFGLSYVDWSHPCRCLGDFTQALHISERAADILMKLILCYLLIGSYGLLIWRWKIRLPGYKPRDAVN